MTVPQVIAVKSAVTLDVSASLLGVETPGAREGDIVLIQVVAFAPTSLDEGSGFAVTSAGLSVEAISKTTVGGFDFVKQTLVAAPATSTPFVYIWRSPGLGPCTWTATAALVRGAVNPLTNPSTWYTDWVTSTTTDFFSAQFVYGDTTDTTDPDQLIVSVGSCLSPEFAMNGWLAGPTSQPVSVWTTLSSLGVGRMGGFGVARSAPDPGTVTAWRTWPNSAPIEPVDSFGIAQTFYLRSTPPAATFPTPAPPQRLRLTCAESYSAFITDVTYENRIDRIGWSSLSWSRNLDEYSRASVTAPDELGGVYCVAKLGGLAPWKFGLIVERNDMEVWKGAIRSVSRPPRSGMTAPYIVIEAVDILGRYEKLPLIYGTPATYENVDSGTVFRDIIVTHAASPSHPWTLRVPKFFSNTTMSRTLRASDNQSAYEVLKEIMDSSADVTVVNGEIYAFDPARGWMYAGPNYDLVIDGPYNAKKEFVFGLFTSEAFSEMPGWSIAGGSQGNYVAVSASGIGELGFSKVHVAQDVISQAEYGILLLRDNQSVQRSDADMPVSEDETLIQRANSMLALHSREPAVISGGSLAEGAPIDIPHLVPGSIWNIDIHDNGYGQLLQQGRLKRVDIDVRMTDEGMTEQISPTLHPVGYEAGDL